MVTAGLAEARPKRRDASAAFDRGLAAYKKGSFEAAAAAFNKSFELERDIDTLFAWAQAERKLEHCDKAIDLYDKLLGFDLPPANREAVEHNREECRALISAQAPEAGAPPVGSAPPSKATSTPADAPPAAAAAPSSGPDRAWYRDPLTLGLVGTGVVATGVGAGLLVSARSLDNDFKHAGSLDEARSLSDQARARGNLGLITAAAGGALVIGGVAYLLLQRDSSEQRVVTGWLAPGGGGLALGGAF